MIPGRGRLALATDIANAEYHVPPGNGVGCTQCGISTVAYNPNFTVTYEGKQVLVDGTIFTSHSNPGRVACGVGHDTAAMPLSDSTRVPTSNDGLIKVNGLLPIHLGDILVCGAKIVEI